MLFLQFNQTLSYFPLAQISIQSFTAGYYVEKNESQLEIQVRPYY